MSERPRWKDNPKVRELHDKVLDVLLRSLHARVNLPDFTERYGGGIEALLNEVERAPLAGPSPEKP